MSSERRGNEKVESCASRKNTVAAMPANLSVGEALERAQSAYLDYCYDQPAFGDEYNKVGSELAFIRASVGNNPLIVDSVLQCCDEETLRSCQLVNHCWRDLTLNYMKLHLKRANDNLLELVLQNKEGLTPFKFIRINPCIRMSLPEYWINFSPYLTSLELYWVAFEQAADIYKLIFDTFPCLKRLDLCECAVKVNPEKQETAPDFQTTTPQLQEIKIVCRDVNLDGIHLFDYFNEEFCLKAISKLRNIKKITWVQSSDTSLPVPLFAALTNGNIKVECLHYDAWGNNVETSDVIKEYFRVCDDSLQQLQAQFPVSSCQDIFRGFAANNLVYLYQEKADYNHILEKDYPSLETIKLNLVDQSSFNFVSKLPNLKTLKIIADCEFCEDEDPPEETQPLQNLSVARLEIHSINDERNDKTSVESWSKWNYYFQAFPNVLEWKMTGYSTYPHVYEALKESGKHWRNLILLELDTALPPDSGNNWRDIVANLAIYFPNLEIFISHDAETKLDQHSISSLLSLSNLRTVQLAKAKIGKDFYGLLKAHVLNLTISELNFDM